MSKSAAKKIDPREIETTKGTQSRYSVSQSDIDDFAEDMRSGDLFPQIIVYAEKGSERYILADGFKRLSAHLAVKPDEQIACDVREGGILEAKLYAVSANAKHGVRRTPMDVRHCIRMALLEPEWQGWSNSYVANVTETNAKTVAKVREELTLSGELGNGNKKRKYKTKDGKTVETTVKKKKTKKSSKKNGSQQRSQDEFDREEIMTAMATFKRAVCSGSAAVDRYNLVECLPDAKAAKLWLEELIEELERRQAPSNEDEAEFLRPS